MRALTEKYSEERLLKILLAPVITEKANFLGEKNNQMVFLVTRDANKLEVKAAVEYLFKVQVDSVQIANRQGKRKRSARRTGRSTSQRQLTRRAFIRLNPDHEIHFAQEVQ